MLDVKHCTTYSEALNYRGPPLTDRPSYQILPHTNSYFHSLCSYLDLSPRGPWGTPGGRTLGATGEGLWTALARSGPNPSMLLLRGSRTSVTGHGCPLSAHSRRPIHPGETMQLGVLRRLCVIPTLCRVHTVKDIRSVVLYE